MHRLLLTLSFPLTLFLSLQFHTSSPRHAPGWDVLQPMNTGRSEIAAAVLGDKVYIAGGIGFFRALKSCEVYDIKDNSWSHCPDLPLGLHHVAMASDKEHVYATGGYSGLNFGHHMDAKIWQLDGDEWLEVANLPEPIGEHSMVGHDGAVYLIGGRSPNGDSAAFRKFAPDTQRWTKLADLPVARHSFAAFIANDELWVTGGRNSAQGTKISRTDIYNFSHDKWRQGPDLPIGRGGHAAAFINGQVHIMGGEIIPSGSATELIDAYEVFDQKSGAWTTAPLMPMPRHGHAAITYNDKIYIFGGGAKPALKTAWTAKPSVQRFDPFTAE